MITEVKIWLENFILGLNFSFPVPSLWMYDDMH